MKTSALMPASEVLRLRLAVRGAVQGVGFRPFVFRLATQLGLRGWVNNTPDGVFVETEGNRPVLEEFRLRLDREKPPRCFFSSLEAAWLEPAGYQVFEIRESAIDGRKTALVLPDIATCPDCLREIRDPANRRFQYPFTNCTDCGPRFSIIEALPYDRANTSMKHFAMCRVCWHEYVDPNNRRFHAQPNACPVCGPQLALLDSGGHVYNTRHSALLAAVKAIRAGQIVAVKGVGGFHLMVDARNDEAVRLLRKRKCREEKPFAVMFPTAESAREFCELSSLEESLLGSPAGPIVLLAKIAGHESPVADSVAPGNPNLGVMLPSNPLHHLLLAELGFPVIATSGNLSDEPICIDEREALARLRGIAAWFLVHNRPIIRHEDDSIIRVVLGREMILRRARGYAPLPLDIQCPETGSQNLLATGADLKNSIALTSGNQVFLSQHVGDLELEQSNAAFRRVIADFEKIYDMKPDRIVADLHPGYYSSRYAHAGGTNVLGVQHHAAHVLSCMAENEVSFPALGIAWDGTGYGPDGTIWGGEFFVINEDAVERVAHLRPFRLPGSDLAAREPRRAAAGLLHEMFGAVAFERRELPLVNAFTPAELVTIRGMLERGFNSPYSSSMGRLFDAVAALINLRQYNHYEGQAAMELEHALHGLDTAEHYHFSLSTHHQPGVVMNWLPVVAALIEDVQQGEPAGLISARFHNALVEMAVAVARQMEQDRVVLSGGCFQNRYLTERIVRRLREEGFQPFWHQRVPPNDGGIALGQIFAARHNLNLR